LSNFPNVTFTGGVEIVASW